jgi:predicted metalloprotease with PDZ domain
MSLKEIDVADMGRHLDKAFETKEFDELADSPVEALEGLSSSDAAALKQAFHISTIRELAESKFVLRAQAICNLAQAEKASGRR